MLDIYLFFWQNCMFDIYIYFKNDKITLYFCVYFSCLYCLKKFAINSVFRFKLWTSKKEVSEVLETMYRVVQVIASKFQLFWNKKHKYLLYNSTSEIRILFGVQNIILKNFSNKDICLNLSHQLNVQLFIPLANTIFSQGFTLNNWNLKHSLLQMTILLCHKLLLQERLVHFKIFDNHVSAPYIW